MRELPKEGDFCYVDIVAEGTYEGRVISEGKDYKIKLLNEDRTVEAPNSAVWKPMATGELTHV